MRTTLILDNNLIHDAAQATGVQEKTKLVHMGLQSLIREAAAKRLARLYGVAKKARVPSRRQSHFVQPPWGQHHGPS